MEHPSHIEDTDLITALATATVASTIQWRRKPQERYTVDGWTIDSETDCGDYKLQIDYKEAVTDAEPQLSARLNVANPDGLLIERIAGPDAHKLLEAISHIHEVNEQDARRRARHAIYHHALGGDDEDADTTAVDPGGHPIAVEIDAEPYEKLPLWTRPDTPEGYGVVLADLLVADLRKAGWEEGVETDDVARRIGLSGRALWEFIHGGTLDAALFVRLCQWLNQPPSRYISNPQNATDEKSER